MHTHTHTHTRSVMNLLPPIVDQRSPDEPNGPLGNWTINFVWVEENRNNDDRQVHIKMHTETEAHTHTHTISLYISSSTNLITLPFLDHTRLRPIAIDPKHKNIGALHHRTSLAVQGKLSLLSAAPATPSDSSSRSTSHVCNYLCLSVSV